jgi:hypothetical protein
MRSIVSPLFLKMWVRMLVLGMMLLPITLFAQPSKTCDNCFNTEVVEVFVDDDCITFTLKVNASDCIFALSHFSVAIACGEVTNTHNSGNWKMEYIVTDPTTGIKGLKVDDINNFADDGDSSSFFLSYTVCSSSDDCFNEILNSSINVAYKAANCVFYENVVFDYSDSLEIDPIVDDEVIVVIEPLTASIEPSDASCFGMNNGSVIVNVEGGTAPYFFNWDNGSVEQNLVNVSAGVYSVVVTDADGETIELSAQVYEPQRISISGNILHANCALNDGAISINVSGGNGLFSYKWNNGAITKNIDGLVSGAYRVDVVDSLGCTGSMPFWVASQTPLKVEAKTNTLECHERESGFVEISVFGGTEPYSFKWSSGETTQNIYNKNAGSYSVTVTDAEGCVFVRNVTINRKIFYVSASVENANCLGQGGSVALNPINGSEPYSAVWSNGESGLFVNDLLVGSYSVLVADANGCQILQHVTIKGENPISVNAHIKNEKCSPNEGGIVVELSANGGVEPYSYFLDGNDIESSFILINEGYYMVEVVDANGCSASQELNVNRSEQFSINIIYAETTCDDEIRPSALVSLSNGTAPYTVFWNGVEGELFIEGLYNGNYEVLVIDANGCEATDSFNVSCISNNDSDSDSNNGGDSEGDEGETPDGNDADNDISGDDDVSDLDGDDTEITEPIDNPTDNNDDAIDDDSDVIVDDVNSDYCNLGGITIDKLVVTNIGNGCYFYEYTFVTDGSLRFDLSHLVIDLNGNEATNVSNSNGWKLEVNSRDPKSQLLGIKVDDISGFGKTLGDSFKLSFELCNPIGFDAQSVVVAFKAGRCFEIEMLNAVTYIVVKHNDVRLSVYPNPAIEDVWFEFSSSVDSNVSLVLYNELGIHVKTLYNNTIFRGKTYKVNYSGSANDTMIMYYKFISDNKILDGKILRLR